MRRTARRYQARGHRAHRSVAQQHIEELAQFFVPAEGQPPGLRFPDGDEIKIVVHAIDLPAGKGLDTASALTRHATALRAQGYDFVMRYYSRNAAKNLSLGEARALSAAGLLVGAVWETAGTHASFFNRAQGVADGGAAFNMAQVAIGQPAGSAIYFAVDYDATETGIEGAVSDYFAGVKMAFAAAADGASPYAIGVYGSGLCCDTLADKQLASLGWLSQSIGFAGSKGAGGFIAQQLHHDDRASGEPAGDQDTAAPAEFFASRTRRRPARRSRSTSGSPTTAGSIG